MKLVTKLVGWLVAFTLFIHYYCAVNECSTELSLFCQYTSPVTWHQQLLEHSDIYRENLSPALVSVHEEYTSRVKPPLLRLGHDLNRKICTPLVVCARTKYENFDSQPYFEWIYRQLSALNRKIRFYYNAFVRPRLAKFVYRCKLDEYCYKIHNKIGPFLERTRFIWHYLRPYTEKAKVSLEDGYYGLKNMYYQSSHWMGDGIFTERHSEVVSTSDSDLETEAETEAETESETEDDSESEDAEQDEDFEDVVTLTSTVVVTLTMDEQNAVVASGEPAEKELEVSDQDLLQEEFTAWFHSIDKQSKNLVKMFNKDVDKFVEKKIELLEPTLKEKTQSLSMTSQQQFQKITKAIQDINCTASVDPETGEVIYFDKSGTSQLPVYITRPLIRTLFNETKTQIEEITLEIKGDLSMLIEEVEKKVELIREDILEVYEEWGDVMISEWSKRLAYIDVVAGHLDDSEEGSDVSSENWKKFLSLKKQVISERDALAKKPAKLPGLKAFVNKADYVLSIVTKESGEYTYILRSRANLAFQEREKQERERFRLEQEAQQRAEEEDRSQFSSVEPTETPIAAEHNE